MPAFSAVHSAVRDSGESAAPGSTAKVSAAAVYRRTSASENSASREERSTRSMSPESSPR